MGLYSIYQRKAGLVQIKGSICVNTFVPRNTPTPKLCFAVAVMVPGEFFVKSMGMVQFVVRIIVKFSPLR